MTDDPCCACIRARTCDHMCKNLSDMDLVERMDRLIQWVSGPGSSHLLNTTVAIECYLSEPLLNEFLRRACGHTTYELSDDFWKYAMVLSSKMTFMDWLDEAREKPLGELDDEELFCMFMHEFDEFDEDGFWNMPIDLYLEARRRVCADAPPLIRSLGPNENDNKDLDELIRSGRFDQIADDIIPVYATRNPELFIWSGHADLIPKGTIVEYAADRVRGFAASGRYADPDRNAFMFRMLYDALKEKDMLDTLKPLYDGLDDVEDMVAYACQETDPDWQKEFARCMYGMKMKGIIP